MLVEAPAPSPGEQELFWYAALRTAATRSKITDDGFLTSPKFSAKFRNCQDKSTLSGGALTDGVLFYKIIFEHNF